MYGLRRRKTNAGENHDLRPLPRHCALRFRRHLCRCQLIYHPGKCWPARLTGHSSVGGYVDSILCLDAQFSQLDDERSSRPKTKRQSDDVQKVMVVYSGKHRGHLWLLLPKQLHVRREERSRLCAEPLENEVVHSGWMVEPCVFV